MLKLKRLFRTIFPFLFLVLFSCSQNNNDYSKGKLIWEDHFSDQDSINTDYWTRIPRGESDWSNTMSTHDSLFSVENKTLILKGLFNNFLKDDTTQYLTGGVSTKNKKTFSHGRWEIRAKLQAAKGAWPAFWLLPEEGEWPMGGEVDIMERLNNDDFVYQTVHSYYTQNLKSDKPKHYKTSKINPERFNTYAVELHSDRIDFFVNGEKTFTYPKVETDKKGQFPFNEHKYYLLIDMQLGGEWVGDVDPSTLPVSMEIDWVKFYKFDK